MNGPGLVGERFWEWKWGELIAALLLSGWSLYYQVQACHALDGSPDLVVTRALVATFFALLSTGMSLGWLAFTFYCVDQAGRDE